MKKFAFLFLFTCLLPAQRDTKTEWVNWHLNHYIANLQKWSEQSEKCNKALLEYNRQTNIVTVEEGVIHIARRKARNQMLKEFERLLEIETGLDKDLKKAVEKMKELQ